jgi:hypothetical protein
VEGDFIAEFRAWVTNDLDGKYHLEAKIAAFLEGQGESAAARWSS